MYVVAPLPVKRYNKIDDQNSWQPNSPLGLQCLSCPLVLLC